MSGLKRLSVSTSLLLARPLARQQKQQHLSSLPLLMHRFCGLYHSLCFLPTSTSTRNYSIVISKSVKFANQSNSAGRKQWPMPLSTKAKCAESEASTQHNLSSVVEKEAEKVAGGETKVYGSSSVPPFTKRTRIIDIKGGADEGAKRVGEQLLVRGWVRTCRLQKTFSFIEVNDGSTVSNLQAVVSANAEGHEKVSQGLITTGASVLLDGVLMKSQGSKQKVELQVSKLTLVGGSDATTFPVQKKKLSREYLRTIAHLRPRTNTFGAVARVRNALAFATHKFFQNMGFIWIASPIVTAADCEGAGEQFCVTTLIPGLHGNPSTPINKIPCTKDGLVDWSQDFFGKPAYLTVSGQLNAETYATALCDVYTFGPTFRAENSNTSRHLAEFWMIEPELAFADLKDDMACAFAYLQYVVKYVLDNCKEDMEFFSTWIDNDLITRLTVNS